MKQANFKGLSESAFRRKLKCRTYTGFMGKEIITETWYKLSPEEASQGIEGNSYLAREIVQARKLPEGWIKLITNEARDTSTNKVRGWWQVSLRPYIQGYGCDGTTDENIHVIANCLATQHGFNYPMLMVEAYPKDTSPADDFNWLEDKIILAETFIPTEIDSLLALSDLMQINNYTLAMVLGQRLAQKGLVSDNWENYDPLAFNEHVTIARAACCAAVGRSTC